MIDKLDKLEERINHFFTKGKNANERCFDFFLRSLTFFIILLFVLLYGTLAKADGVITGGSATFTTIGDVSNLGNNEVWNYNYDNMVNSFYTLYGNDKYCPFNNNSSTLYNHYGYGQLTYYEYMTPEFYKSLPYPLTASCSDTTNGNTGMEFSADNYYIVMGHSVTNGTSNNPTSSTFDYSILFVPKDYMLVVEGSNNTQRASIMPISGGYGHIYELNMHVNVSTGEYTGSFSAIGGFQWTGHIAVFNIFYSNMPVYYSNGVSITSNSMENNVLTENTSGYIVDTNIPLTNGDLVPEEPVPEEGPENHLYFKNVQIGMSTFSTETPLLNSSFIVGVDVDNYVKNNMDKFYVFITYHIHYKDNTEVNTAFNEVQPLAIFYNNAYVKGVNEVFSNAPLSGGLDSNFYAFYNRVKSSSETNFDVMSEVNKNMNSVFPSLTQVKDFMTGVFKTRNYNSANTPNVPHLNEFYIDVSVVMSDTDNVSQNVGGVYTQRFDFINGTTSIMKSDGLVNQNPFEGETQNVPDPFLQNGSANGSGGSVVQNNNQTVNINLNNNVSNVTGGVSDEETDNTVDNMKKVFDEFKNGLGVINESSMDSEGNPNGFLSLLSHTYEFIPGMNYIKTAIAVIVTLAIILFILKVLLF